MRGVILVPRRDGQTDRDLIWAWVRQWWRDHLPELEIFEGHHDIGLFNRSAAVNRAAGAADWQRPEPWDVAVIIDSDVICDSGRVRQAVDKALITPRMVLPFDVRKDLNPQGSRRIMTGDQGNWDRYIHRTYTDMCSGVVVLNRELWDAVGGFDETFVGWGFEDNAFAVACETFGAGPLVKMPGELWHLYHGMAKEGKRGTATHQHNKARADLYLSLSGQPDQLRALIATTQPSFEHRPTGIPPILHRVVPERTEPEADRWWAQFAKLHPDWMLMEHRDPLDPAEWPETAAYWPRAANGAQLADLVRLEALLRWGGIYVDQDVEPYRAFDPLLPLSAFAGWEDRNSVPNAVMGAVPAHPAVRACLDLMTQRLVAGAGIWDCGPGVLTAVLPGRADVLLLPPGSFYPYHYNEKERRGEDHRRQQPWAFCAHHWWGSWLKEAAG